MLTMTCNFFVLQKAISGAHLGEHTIRSGCHLYLKRPLRQANNMHGFIAVNGSSSANVFRLK